VKALSSSPIPEKKKKKAHVSRMLEMGRWVTENVKRSNNPEGAAVLWGRTQRWNLTNT
jgi:hypothetical protein